MKRKFTVRSAAGWLLLAVCVILAGWATASGARPPEPTRYEASGRMAAVKDVPVQAGSIPVNTGDAALLDELPGVGEATAQKIIDERDLNGPFFYPEDMMQVHGIGEKKLEDMRTMLDLTEE